MAAVSGTPARGVTRAIIAEVLVLFKPFGFALASRPCNKSDEMASWRPKIQSLATEVPQTDKP